MTTIGVVVDLPPPWAAALQDYRLGLGDGSGEGIAAHITLLSPVDVAPELMAEIREHLTSVAAGHPPFRVRLRGTDSFRPVSPVVFLHLDDGVEACGRLAAAVRQGPLAVVPPFPYHPHVTLAHDVADDVLDRAQADYADFALDLEVAAFRLYRHDDEQGWVPMLDLTLSGGA
jgi:2'-5' RNA ligase